MADLMSASPNRPCPYLGELSVTHLKDEKLYISKKKFDPFAPVLDILGCKVDTHGVHTDSDKLAKLRDWQVPMDHTEVPPGFYQILVLTWVLYRPYALIICCSDGPPCTKSVLTRSK